MKFIDATTPGGKRALRQLNRQCEPDPRVREAVAEALAAVQAEGDAAVLRLAEKFDRVRLTARQMRVRERELERAAAAVPAAVARALRASHRNVRDFARQSLRRDWQMKNAQGATVGEIFRPFERVGLYVPGGTAPLVSTAIMTVTLAAVAGCSQIVVCTPCGADGTVNPVLLAALRLSGATEVYRLGGIQAIGAMAYGTRTIRPVLKIFGPGNAWVVEAKRQVFGRVAIDQLPGPSEILILADESGRADYIAADLVAQAEHGHGSQAVLVTPCRELALAVQEEVAAQLGSLSRQEHLREALGSHGWIVHVPDLQSGVALANDYAPEHLTLIVKDEKAALEQIRGAGAIFLGNHSPVAAGDYLAGPSHTLPTGGAAKSFAGLTVDQFQRRTSVVRLDAAAARKSAPLIETLARVEGLDAHGRSAAIRLAE